MSSLPSMVTYDKPIQEIFLFKTYSRESYKQEYGVDAPPFDQTKDPKYWFDSAARSKADRRGIVRYDQVLLMSERGDKVLAGPDGAPAFDPDPLSIHYSEAESLNLPTDGYTNEPGTERPAVPVPTRKLRPNEKLVFFGPLAIPLVRDVLAYNDAQAVEPVFTPTDRDVLHKILAATTETARALRDVFDILNKK